MSTALGGADDQVAARPPATIAEGGRGPVVPAAFVERDVPFDSGGLRLAGTLTLPVGAAPPLDLYIGVYNSAGGGRLPAFDAQGNPVTNDEAMLAQDLSLP